MQMKLRFSWILEGMLAVGERPHSYFDLERLGFTAALNLQEEQEPNPEGQLPEGFLCERVSMEDGIVGGIPSIEQIRRAVNVVARFLAEGRPTYVHCYAGVGRSPTVCMAFLGRTESLSLVQAYDRVAAAHDLTDPTSEQLSALDQYLQTMSGR